MKRRHGQRDLDPITLEAMRIQEQQRHIQADAGPDEGTMRVVFGVAMCVCSVDGLLQLTATTQLNRWRQRKRLHLVVSEMSGKEGGSYTRTHTPDTRTLIHTQDTHTHTHTHMHADT